jgi:hypothetical protein
MMEQEFGKLIAAVERIAVAVEKLAAKDAPASTPVAEEPVDKKSEAAPKPKKKSGDNRVTAPASSTAVDDQFLPDEGITYDEMYKVMFEIAQASSEAKKLILPMLESYGYNHVQKVKPEHYAEIHAKLLTIATRIAKGEID